VWNVRPSGSKWTPARPGFLFLAGLTAFNGIEISSRAHDNEKEKLLAATIDLDTQVWDNWSVQAAYPRLGDMKACIGSSLWSDAVCMLNNLLN
jgi:hypothetical protein